MAKRKVAEMLPLGLVRPTLGSRSFRGPSEVSSVRFRRLRAEQRAHEERMADVRRELFPDHSSEIQAIFAHAVKRISAAGPRWERVGGRWVKVAGGTRGGG